MAPAQPLIRLVDVAKSFGPLCVLDGVTLDLLRGQTTVVVGPSGTGKSVLLKHIVGLIRPDRGAVWFDDLCISRLGAADLVSARTRIGFLFQMGALFDSMSVGENIMFPLREHTRQSRLQRRWRSSPLSAKMENWCCSTRQSMTCRRSGITPPVGRKEVI